MSSLRFVLHGAAPCPVPVKQAMIEWWAGRARVLRRDRGRRHLRRLATTWLTKPGTVGQAASRRPASMIGDEDGSDCPPARSALVYLKAPARRPLRVLQGPGQDRRARYRGDYFTLGDVGYLDEDGYLFLTDRSANLIISGGVNIYPAEVDAVLLDAPGRRRRRGHRRARRRVGRGGEGGRRAAARRRAVATRWPPS